MPNTYNPSFDEVEAIWNKYLQTAFQLMSENSRDHQVPQPEIFDKAFPYIIQNQPDIYYMMILDEEGISWQRPEYAGQGESWEEIIRYYGQEDAQGAYQFTLNEFKKTLYNTIPLNQQYIRFTDHHIYYAILDNDNDDYSVLHGFLFQR